MTKVKSQLSLTAISPPRATPRSFGFRADALAAVLGEGGVSFRQMFDPAPVGIVLADRDGRVVESNRALQALLGYSAAELAGVPYADLVHPADRPEAVAGAQELSEGERGSLRLEVRCLRKDGAAVWTRVHVAPVAGPDGGWHLAVVTIEDIHEQKRLEERLLQSQKLEAMGRLAAGIAHDFNNLVTVVTGYTDILLGRGDLGDTARGDVGEIRRAAARAGELTRQLLAFGGRQMLQPAALDLNDVVREMEAMLRRVIGKDVELVTELEADLPRVRIDPGQLEQVIVNLALNARDAMPGGGKLVLSTRNTEGERPHAALAVSDTGVGMDEATLAHIFEPFFTTKEPGKGTGLGLATVYGIVEQSGGRVEVASAPGRGSTFTIVLPSAEPGALPESRPALRTA